MICEKCGCHDRVTRTIRKADSVTRLRRCINCGDIVKTVEQKVEKPKSKRRKKKAASPNKDDATPVPPKGALAQALADAS